MPKHKFRTLFRSFLRKFLELPLVSAVKQNLTEFFIIYFAKLKILWKLLVTKIKSSKPYLKFMALPKRRRFGTVAALLFILSLGLGFGIYKKFFYFPHGFGGMPVEAAIITPTPLTRSIDAIGISEADEATIIRPEVAGRITQILFKEGQTVEAQAPLLKLDDAIADATLKEVTAGFILSKAEYERTEALIPKGSVSVNERDIKLARFQANEAALAKAQSTLEKMTIKAPFSGIIGLRKVSPGDFVNVGQEIVNLVDINPIKVNFQIPEIYLNDIREGQTVKITTDAYKDKVFTGTIYAVDPAVNPHGHSILLRAKLNNDDKLLKPGLFMKINLILAQIPEAVLIPDQAIILNEGKQFVYKIQEGKAILTQVTLGERQNNQVEILNGVQINDVIITAGQMKIGPNSPVMPINLPKQPMASSAPAAAQDSKKPEAH